eukprot:5435085-Pyramimonas_sp.AAC.2
MLKSVVWSSEDAQGPQHRLQTAANQGVQYTQGGNMISRIGVRILEQADFLGPRGDLAVKCGRPWALEPDKK